MQSNTFQFPDCWTVPPQLSNLAWVRKGYVEIQPKMLLIFGKAEIHPKKIFESAVFLKVRGIFQQMKKIFIISEC